MLELSLQIISIALRNNLQIIILNECVRVNLKELFKVKRANIFTIISDDIPPTHPDWLNYLVRIQEKSQESKAELLFVIKGTILIKE